MNTIHKYRLEGSKTLHTIRLREGYRILRSEYLMADNAFHLWVEEPVNMLIPRHEHHFLVDVFGGKACRIFEVNCAYAKGGIIAEPMAAA